jgi:NAD(P)-dependent dehydrogenase (short-subunit alcohol dehydrogenase family)
MDLDLTGRGALVVGANGGIGRAVSHAFVREGIGRLTLGVRSEDAGHALAEELARHGATSLAVVECDLDDADSPERCVAESTRSNGPVDILAMCAGAAPNARLLEFDDADWSGWEETIQAKLLGTARLVRAVAPAMLERGWGRIVVVTGMTSRAPKPQGIIGGTVNVALTNLVTALAKELVPAGVNINAVDPAFVRTPRWEKRLDRIRAEMGFSDDEAVAHVLKAVPSNSMTTPQEVADVVVFLSSDRAAAIAGSAIHVDHGSYPGL